MNSFSFTLDKSSETSDPKFSSLQARAGRFSTPHGDVLTPIFMPVGTQATVKSLDAVDMEKLVQAQIMLSNTYHLYLRPGTERLLAAGGLHRFMNWDKPILTDSGGFQVFSLGSQAEGKGYQSKTKISEEGVRFTSHLDGSKHEFTPESAIQIQRHIGADIIMAFDECTPDQATAQYARQALDRTHAWAKRCVQEWEYHNRLSTYGHYQALFGIVQGALHPDLRQESARFMADLPFDGIAVGGETIGYNMEGTVEVMKWLRGILPEDKPRYAMGLGRDPQDLVNAVKAGFDMFDCVGPTRLARNGTLYFGQLVAEKGDFRFETPYNKGRLQIGRQEFATDRSVIQEGCDCYTCSHGYSRAYLHHLSKVQELVYYRLASLHNVRFMVRLSQEIREAVINL